MGDRLKYREFTNQKYSKSLIPLLKTNTMSKDPPISKESKLLLKLMETYGPRRSIIDATNHWMERNINLQLGARTIPTNDGYVKLSNIRVEKQVDSLIDQNVVRTPRYCRDNGYTYEGIVKTDATYYPNKSIGSNKFNPLTNESSLTHQQKTEAQMLTTKKDITLGKIPIMVQSDLCILSDLSKGQRLNLGECTNDVGGNFIIEGGEKAIISQEKLRTGEYILWKNDDTGKIECLITCVTDSGTTVVSLVQGTRWETLKVGIHYAGSRNKHIPLYVAFAFLGYDESNATDLISHFIPEKLRLATLTYLQSSMTRARSVGNNIVAYIVNKKAKQKGTTREYNDKASDVTKAVQHDLFANIKSLNGKAKSLAFMVAQIILCTMGDRPLNDRDDYSLKKIHTPAKLMEIKLNTIWTEILRKISLEMHKVTSHKGIDSFVSIMGHNEMIIGEEFTKSFLRSWKSKNGQVTESVVEALKRDTPAALISQITRLNAPSSTRGKKSEIREVNNG